MKMPKNNFAYIDSANLHKGVASLGWTLDYKRFRVWLSEKYGVRAAYLFIGLIPKYKELYKHLQESGFTLVFKEVVYDGDGKPKDIAMPIWHYKQLAMRMKINLIARSSSQATATMRDWLSFCKRRKSYL